MANTSVHFPEGMLDELDRVAAERGVSRNRIIVESCRETLLARRQWPEGFFSNDHLTPADRAELERSAEDFTKVIRDGRRSRSGPPF